MNILTLDSQNKDKSSYQAITWRDLIEAWTITNDSWRNPLYIRNQKTKYLDQFKLEPNEKYQQRLGNSVYISEFRNTIETMTGMVLRKDPAPEELDESIRSLFTDIDLCGNSFYHFLLNAFDLFLRDGNYHIFVESSPFTSTAEQTTTLAQRIDDRPWWVGYEAKQLINSREEIIDGKKVLTLAVFEVYLILPDGEFGEKTVTRHYVYRRGINGGPATFETFEKNDKGEFVSLGSVVTLATPEIPLVSFADFDNEPPLLSLALLNIQYYNKTSDFDDWCHRACVPLLFRKFDTLDDATSEKAKEARQSVGFMMYLWGEHSEIGFAEVSGAGIEIAQRRYQEIERLMAKQGVGMFEPSQQETVKTATEIIDQSGKSQSKLSRYAHQFENAIEKALYITGEVINATMGAGTVDLSEQAKSTLRLKLDYDRLVFSTQQLQFFASLVDSGKMSLQTFLNWLPKVVDLPEDFDPEAERLLIAGERSQTDDKQITDNTNEINERQN